MLTKSHAHTLLSFCALAAIAACNSGTSSAEPTCSEVCARFGTLCGPVPEGCDSACAGLSAAAKRCVVAASSCDVASMCHGEAPHDSGVADARNDAATTTDSSTGPTCPKDFTTSCPSGCRQVSGGAGGTPFCTSSCSVDGECGAGYDCNTAGSYCSWSCGDSAACGDFASCNIAGGHCTF